MSDLTVLVVSQYEPHADSFLNDLAVAAEALDARFVEHDGRGAGVIEHVLDDAIATCPNGYILRVDDDERISLEMLGWLATGAYREQEHWAFPRMNLWPDADHFITSHSLWPDYQTRLSVKAKSGGRTGVHDGSPFGTGELAPCAIEHHKFLVRSEAERREILARYEALGADRGHAQFSVPEDLGEVALLERSRVAA